MCFNVLFSACVLFFSFAVYLCLSIETTFCTFVLLVCYPENDVESETVIDSIQNVITTPKWRRVNSVLATCVVQFMCVNFTRYCCAPVVGFDIYNITVLAYCSHKRLRRIILVGIVVLLLLHRRCERVSNLNVSLSGSQNSTLFPILKSSRKYLG